MQPYDQYNQQADLSSQQKKARNLLKIIAVAVVAIILIVVGLSIHSSNGFRVIGTTPDLTNIGTITPYITFNFNEPLTTDGLAISSGANVITSTKVDGDKLIVGLSSTMNVGNTYSINLDTVKSTTGSLLSGQTFSYKAKLLLFEDLPKEQQQAVLQEQSNKSVSRDNYNYNGEEQLIDNGLTTDQITDLRQALFNYFQSAKVNATDVTYSNVNPAAPHPDDPLSPDVRSFNIKFAGTTYAAKASSSDLYTARLYLYDSSGAVLFDSKDIRQ